MVSDPVGFIPDRPFADRPYGRVRLYEKQAWELNSILETRIDVMRQDIEDNKEVLDTTYMDEQLRIDEQLLHNVHWMIHEKGWCDCEIPEFDGAVTR